MTDDVTPPVPDPRRAAAQIPEVDRRALLRLARRSIADFLERGTYPEIPTGSGALLVPRAVFVTLRHRETRALRGCVGQVTAKGPLAQAVMHMAVAAATQDPRFPAVDAGELEQLRIEISALTEMVPITVDRIEVGRHGLLLRWRGRSGLLLPGVALEHRWSCDELLSGLCRKAGVPDGSWLDGDAELMGFETESWEESE
jgi:AmmeMemoRadiSam system protein A